MNSTTQAPPALQLRAYIVSLDGQHWETVHSTSRGAAKMWYYRHLDCDYPYLRIQCRVAGRKEKSPTFHTSQEFIRNAKYRNIEFAYCGMKVKVNECNGVIIGHNSSANLNIFFTDGKYAGETLNCHPHSGVIYFDKEGNVINHTN